MCAPTDSRTHTNAATNSHRHPQFDTNAYSAFAYAHRAPTDCCAQRDAIAHRDYCSTIRHADAHLSNTTAYGNLNATAAAAQEIYDAISAKRALPEFQPRALSERFNVRVLCTTDSATDSLEHHRTLRASAWRGKILPTFRPDALLDISNPQWHAQIHALANLTRADIGDYDAFIHALETRRAQFQELGALATDCGATLPFTEELSHADADAIFQRALQRQASSDDARRFMGHMLMEMARMSIEAGLVMQLHVSSHRNHNAPLFERFGADRGADIPIAIEFTRNLLPLLNRFGNDPRLMLILFTLDESTYARELAPLAGHYPTLKLGPPWWFHDSVNGMRRYLDSVMETAGIYNTVGFNDDTRAFPSIPARHDVWRRACANWLAGLVVRGIIDNQEANEMQQTFFDLPADALRAAMDLNLFSTMLSCQVFGKAMANARSGAIINISSMAATKPLTRVIAYAAAKAGVENFTRGLAVYMAREISPALRVNAIAPGFFVGEQNRAFLLDPATNELTPRGRAIIEHTPMARFGDPADLIGTLLWLASPASAFVTGVVVPVDGGFSAFGGI
jgi:glucuronate isomerase